MSRELRFFLWTALVLASAHAGSIATQEELTYMYLEVSLKRFLFSKNALASLSVSGCCCLDAPSSRLQRFHVRVHVHVFVDVVVHVHAAPDFCSANKSSNNRPRSRASSSHKTPYRRSNYATC